MSNSRSKNKILVFIIFLLLLTNVLVLGYFLRYCKKAETHKDKEGFTDILKRDVGFNEQQIAQFNELKKNHWEKAKSNMDSIVKIKNMILDLSKLSDTQDSTIERFAENIGILQKGVEVNAYKHVRETRKICTAKQQPAYDSLIRKLVNKGRQGKTTSKPAHSESKL